MMAAGPGGPVLQFGLVAVGGGLVVGLLLAGPLEGALWPVALVLHAAVTLVAGWGLIRSYPHRALGLCNIVTQVRAAMIVALAGLVPVAGRLPDDLALAAVVLATVALLLDGVDGWAARRSGLSSRFGARFDMEIDSIFALILTLIVLQLDKVGPWAVLLGVARYLFVAAMWAWPWLNRPTPPRFAGKVVCVVQIAVLIALIAPFVTGGLAVVLALGAVAGVVWSFGVDILWLWRRRA